MGVSYKDEEINNYVFLRRRWIKSVPISGRCAKKYRDCNIINQSKCNTYNINFSYEKGEK